MLGFLLQRSNVMSAYSLKNRRVSEIPDDSAADFEPAFIFHLSSGGEIKKLERPLETAELSDGDGLFMYSGDFYVEPLEILIDFIKSADAKSWFEAVIIRHIERIRRVNDSLLIFVKIKD